MSRPSVEQVAEVLLSTRLPSGGYPSLNDVQAAHLAESVLALFEPETVTTAAAVLDAATADVEAMARVLDPDAWDFPEECSGEIETARQQAQALRDWMLGGEG